MPPRNPLGILKVLVVKRIRNILELKRLCDIEEYERPYHPSQLSRFRKRIGLERLKKIKIMGNILEKLRKAKIIKGKIIACDATFIKAYNKRDPKNDSKDYSDPEARVGRASRAYRLGYKLHLAVDTHSELPIATITAPANQKQEKTCIKAFRENHRDNR